MTISMVTIDAEATCETVRESYLTDATLILRDECIKDGAVVVSDGHIAEICPAQRPEAASEVSLGNALLLPGLIDLHTDAIELKAAPRPNSTLPMDIALRQSDYENAICGISTVYHSLCFAGRELGIRDDDFSTRLGEHVVKKTTDRLVDHHLHCRFEVTNSKGVPRVAELIRSGACTLLSFMDHTPGQGQFGTMDEYRHYLKTAYGFTDDYFDELMVEKFDGNRHAEHNMAILQTVAKQHGIPIASHDDDSAEKVRQMKQFGVTICEFPVDRAAAQQARELQLHAMVGTPNIIRGGSTSPTGISALELISAGQADCLCSDYVPFTMLLAIFKTAEALDWPLNKAAALATANPAQAASLTDRGEIATGKRADLLAVSYQANRLPRVLRLFRAGREVMRVA